MIALLRQTRVMIVAVSMLVAGLARAEHGLFPDVRAPIGVFGEAVHAKGDVMISYRYQRIVYDDMMVGDEIVSTPKLAALTSFAVLPTRMESNHHIFEINWVPFEETTLILAIPYITKSMTQRYLSGGFDYTTSVHGFGDLELTLLYRVFESKLSRVQLNLGVSLPTGTINATAGSPANGSPLERLPYMMQLGSGTFDIRPGFTYNGFLSGYTWGTQVTGVLHAGTNGAGYTLGNRYDVTGWYGRRWYDWLNTAFRLDWQQWSDPTGEDSLVALLAASGTSDAVNSPAYVADLQGGRRLDALFSLDFYIGGGMLEGTRLAIEGGLPIYQSLDGPQLRAQWLLSAGLQYAF